MNYDKNSFLSGVAVGRQLKGWGACDFGSMFDQDIRNLRTWSRYIADPQITYRNGVNDMTILLIPGYEKMYCVTDVDKNSRYTFSLYFSTQESFPRGITPYMGASAAIPCWAGYDGSYLARTALQESFTPTLYSVTFSTGSYERLFLFLDWARMPDGQTFHLRYADLTLTKV